MRGQPGDSFAALGLDPSAEVTDDDVRIAWRRIAAASHPDRADRGDAEAFAIAAAAYADLRTAYGRGEARANGLLGQRGRQARRATQIPPAASVRKVAARAASTIRHGRAVRLAARTLAAVAAATLGFLAAGPGPAGPALAAGAATWLMLTVRRDLRAPFRRRSTGFGAGRDRASRIGGPR